MIGKLDPDEISLPTEQTFVGSFLAVDFSLVEKYFIDLYMSYAVTAHGKTANCILILICGPE